MIVRITKMETAVRKRENSKPTNLKISRKNLAISQPATTREKDAPKRNNSHKSTAQPATATNFYDDSRAEGVLFQYVFLFSHNF